MLISTPILVANMHICGWILGLLASKSSPKHALLYCANNLFTCSFFVNFYRSIITGNIALFCFVQRYVFVPHDSGRKVTDILGEMSMCFMLHAAPFINGWLTSRNRPGFTVCLENGGSHSEAIPDPVQLIGGASSTGVWSRPLWIFWIIRIA